MAETAIIIPLRDGDSPDPADETLRRQTYQDFAACGIPDEGHGAPWARNRGADGVAATPFILFSDADLRWEPDALVRMRMALDEHPECDYAYGPWILEGGRGAEFVGGQIPFDPEALCSLHGYSYIHTSSLIRREKFLGFDDTLTVFQDWELWGRMWIWQGSRGAYCGDAPLFRTKFDPHGISGATPMRAEKRMQVLARFQSLLAVKDLERRGLLAPRKRPVMNA